MRRCLAPLAAIALGPVLAAQGPDLGVSSPAGALAIDQAIKDANADAMVLLVASHPDDRYVLPAVWLRRSFGYRVGVLLATRGGGGQNSAGSQTGDALERIRTLETERGCARLGADVWYLNRPDGGFRRSAVETFAEWGRDGTVNDLARVLRRVRPDAVMTTHHAEEQHGHDLALVELLPEALAKAADPAFAPELPPHRVGVYWCGAGSTPSPREVRIDADRLDRVVGSTWRRQAYDILLDAHRSPGPPAPIDGVFDPVMRFEPAVGAPGAATTVVLDGPRPLGLPSLLDDGRWPGDRGRAAALDLWLRELPRRCDVADAMTPEVAGVVHELRALRTRTVAPDDALRLERRIEALERLSLLLAGVQVEVEVQPGAVAVAGEALDAVVRVHVAAPRAVAWRVEGLAGVEVAVDRVGETDAPGTGPGAFSAGGQRAGLVIRVPGSTSREEDPMATRFLADTFEPPVQLRFHVRIGDLEVPVVLALPVEQRPPADLRVVPRMLLLPSTRRDLEFSVGITRNSRFPIAGDLEVRGAAGYAFVRDRVPVELRQQRSDTFGFAVEAPLDRKPGVDVLRIRLRGNRVELPIHKVDVRTPPGLRVGLVRSRDETLPGMLGAGGLGVDWSELSDADVAVADLGGFDTIVVDIRALRDRLAVRSAFRRLLDFATAPGRRLVVLYQKNVEFQPPGEGFVGAPFLPFQVGTSRVTRADAPVRVLQAQHVLLTHPNAIQPADWDGWEQERALYLPGVWAPQYEEVIEIHDPDQPRERGALLYARTGDGEYVYCALALWRQLKKLHPGAVRLMANLLSPAPRR